MAKNFCSLLVLLILSFSVRAEKSGVESVSFASAGRAHWSGKGAFKSNPAGLLLTNNVAVGADYLYHRARQDSQLRFAITDSATTVWGMGVAYSPIYNSPAGFYYHDVTAILAMPIIPQVFSLGLAGYYVRHKIKKTDEKLNLFNADIGLLLSTPVGFKAAFVVDHIFKEKAHEKPLGIALASSFDFRTLLPQVPFSVHADFVMADFKNDSEIRNEFALGLQYLALFAVPLRLGIRHENYVKENFLAAGTGFCNDHLSLDAAFEQNLTYGKDRFFALGLGVSF